MVSARFTQMIKFRPLYLSWQRQGKVYWDPIWIRNYGPTRQRIPGLDDHIGFANYDLRNNSLPQIQTTDQGRPYVTCCPPMDASEVEKILDAAMHEFTHIVAIKSFMDENVYAPMAKVRGILDVIDYHGFGPDQRTSGLDFLDSVLPRQELRKTDYRPPDLFGGDRFCRRSFPPGRVMVLRPLGRRHGDTTAPGIGSPA